MKRIKYPITASFVVTGALVAFGFLLLGTYFILFNDWGKCVSILWLTPENNFSSFEYLLFFIVMFIASIGGILIFKNPSAGYCFFAASFLLTLVFAIYLSKKPSTSNDLLGGFLLFVLPALFFIRRAKHEISTFKLSNQSS